MEVALYGAGFGFAYVCIHVSIFMNGRSNMNSRSSYSHAITFYSI